MEAIGPAVEGTRALHNGDHPGEPHLATRWGHGFTRLGLPTPAGSRKRSMFDEVEAVVEKVKGRAAESRALGLSLGHLKSLLYDADDIVDELDYFRLQHQVEGGIYVCDCVC
ncbi:unnamed protein product [Urochloa humidicola]